jgi:hypothetical protein
MSDFLDKVYDAYENKDFSYGQDNLNPLREIKPSQNEKSVEEQAYELIKARIDAVQEELNSIEPESEQEDTTVDVSILGESPSKGKTEQEIKSYLKAGTNIDSGSFLNRPFDLDDPDPLEDQIDELIEKISILTGKDTDGKDKPNPSPTTSIEPSSVFNIDCNGVASDISGLSDNDGTGGVSATDNSASDNASGSNSDSTSDDDDNSDDSNNDDEYGYNDAYEKEKAAQATKDAQYQTAALQCAAKELEFLKIILIILRIIAVIKMLVSYAINTAIIVVEIVIAASLAWLVPTFTEKLIKLIMQIVIAIIVNVIGMIIEALWELLDMDCLTSATQGYISQIKEALAGITSIEAQLNPSAISLQSKAISKKIEKANKDFKNAFEKAQKNVSSWTDTKAQAAQAKAAFTEGCYDAAKAAVKAAATNSKVKTILNMYSNGKNDIATYASKLGLTDLKTDKS